jgi:hypothetical protein
LCDACSAGENVKSLECQLCSHTGGAYKRDENDNWVHTQCYLWIQEIDSFVEEDGDTTRTILRTSKLDPKRFRLRCALCPPNVKSLKKNALTEEACLQCAHGRCKVSAHPWCLMHHPQGFRGIVHFNSEGYEHWDMYCKNHVKAHKPFPKMKTEKNNKHTEEYEDDRDEVELDSKVNRIRNMKRHGLENEKNSSSASHNQQVVSNYSNNNIMNHPLKRKMSSVEIDYVANHEVSNSIGTRRSIKPRDDSKTIRTGYVFEEMYMWHDSGSISFNKWTQPGKYVYKMSLSYNNYSH